MFIYTMLTHTGNFQSVEWSCESEVKQNGHPEFFLDAVLLYRISGLAV